MIVEKFLNFLEKIEYTERLGPCRNCVVRAICRDECKTKHRFEEVTEHPLFVIPIKAIGIISIILFFTFFRSYFALYYIFSLVFGVFLVLGDKDNNTPWAIYTLVVFIAAPFAILIFILGISSGFIYAKFQRRW